MEYAGWFAIFWTATAVFAFSLGKAASKPMPTPPKYRESDDD